MQKFIVTSFVKWFFVFALGFFWIFDARWFRVFTGRSDTIYDAWAPEWINGHGLFYSNEPAYNVISTRLARLWRYPKVKLLRDKNETIMNLDQFTKSNWKEIIFAIAVDKFGTMINDEQYQDYVVNMLNINDLNKSLLKEFAEKQKEPESRFLISPTGDLGVSPNPQKVLSFSPNTKKQLGAQSLLSQPTQPPPQPTGPSQQPTEQNVPQSGPQIQSNIGARVSVEEQPAQEADQPAEEPKQ